MTTHLGIETGALCGAKLGSTTEILSEVGCVSCQSSADRLSVILTRARRNGSAPRTEGGAGKALEELGDGGWKLFDLKRWLRAPEGQYGITLRVRRKKEAR